MGRAGKAARAVPLGSRRTLLAASCAGLVAVAGAGHNPPPLDDPLPDPTPSTVTVTLRSLESSPGGLVFPTDAVEIPDGSGRVLIAERAGGVRLLDGGALAADAFLDLSASAASNNGSALSSITLHPDFASAGASGEGLFYTTYQEPPGAGTAHFTLPNGQAVAHQSVIYEWRVDPGTGAVAPASRREILRVDEGFRSHNLNDLAFGLDGTLFIAKGDDDMLRSDTLDGRTVHGAVLRIALDPTAPNGRYRVPADNPFVGNASGLLEEVFAYGFRNPWRASVDRQTGELYAFDIGEDSIEEVNLVQAGAYHGWIDKEGSFAFLGFSFENPSGVTDDLGDLPPGFSAVDPVAQYDHGPGARRSISGGFVYRGTLYPALFGHYVFGDLLSGLLMHVDPADGVVRELQIDPAGAQLDGDWNGGGRGIISVREDADGELLLVEASFSGGRLYGWEVTAPPPVADDLQLETREDETLAFAFSGTFEPGSVSVATPPANGTLDLSGPPRYTPRADYNGPDSFTYSGLDALGRASNVATVTVTVTPVNDPPQALAAAFEVTLGETLTGRLGGSDPEGDALTFALAQAALAGALSIETDGRFSYTPDGSSDADSFAFRVDDGELDSLPATVTITVRGGDPGPLADDLAIATREDETLTFAFAGTFEPGTVSIDRAPANGTLDLTGAPSYRPRADYNGTDTFTYYGFDARGRRSNTATVSVTIAAVNDPPRALAAAFEAMAGKTLTGRLAGSDPEGDGLTFAVARDASAGVLARIAHRVLRSTEFGASLISLGWPDQSVRVRRVH